MNEEEEFRKNIIRTIQAVHKRILHSNTATLSALEQENALHVLERYAVNFAPAWPCTRDLLLLLAPKMEQTEQQQRWFDILQAGLTQSQAQADPLLEAHLHFHIAQLYYLSSHYHEATEHLERSRELFTAQRQPRFVARSINKLAYLVMYQDNHGAAVALVHEAMELSDELSPEYATSLSVLGLVSQFQSRFEDATRFHTQALKIRQELNLQKETAWSLQNIGIALREQGKFQESTNFLRNALKLLEGEYDPVNQAVIKMNLSANYDILGEPRRALRILNDAESRFNLVLNEYNLAKLLTTKGLCHLSLQNYEQAENAFTMSAELFEKFNNLGWALNAWDGVGICYLRRGWYEDALAIFNIILVRLPEIQDTQAYRYLVNTVPVQIESARQHISTMGGGFDYHAQSGSTPKDDPTL